MRSCIDCGKPTGDDRYDICEPCEAGNPEFRSKAAWQLLDTAPKDGTRILVWDSYDDETVVFWSKQFREWRLGVPGAYAEDSSHTFTHWMPLPIPPVKP